LTGQTTLLVFLGAGARSNADEGPDHAPPGADLRTAEHLGRRVATVAKELAAGRLLLKESREMEVRPEPKEEG